LSTLYADNMKRAVITLLIVVAAFTMLSGTAGAAKKPPKLDGSAQEGCRFLALYYIDGATDPSGLADVATNFQASKTKGVKALGKRLENAATEIGQRIALDNATRLCVKAGIVTTNDLAHP
jgi:hypothetical protein